MGTWEVLETVFLPVLLRTVTASLYQQGHTAKEDSKESSMQARAPPLLLRIMLANTTEYNERHTYTYISFIRLSG